MAVDGRASTRCRRGRSQRRFTATPARTSTASSSRAGWARCSATTWWRPARATSSQPRDQWHTFWNAGDEPCRILEIISPAGFERFFAELDAIGGVAGAGEEAVAELSQRYGLEMQPETVPELIDRFGVLIGEPLSGGWRP